MLDMSRKYLKIKGDGPIAFEQDGKLYNNMHDQIDATGKVLEKAPPEHMNGVDHAPAPGTNGASPPAKDGDGPTAEELLEEAAGEAKRPFLSWKADAKKILGDKCPGTKADILKALEASLEAVKPAPKQQAAGAPEPTPAPTDGKQNKPKGPARLPDGHPDRQTLYLWGSGQKKMLFGKVRQMMREGYNRVFHNERDALNFLVDEGVVPAAEAMNIQ